MNTRVIACSAVAALIVGTGVSRTSLAPSTFHDTTFSIPVPVLAAASTQDKGRFKKEGDNCVWEANDAGPNQCTPVTRGRFKKGADDSCTWDSNDNGPDQCKPPKGRWKRGGDDSCTWDAKDDGPNQCNPRRARTNK